MTSEDQAAQNAHYEALATEYCTRIDSRFNAAKVFAACEGTARALSTPERPSGFHYLQAARGYLAGLPDDINAAIKKIDADSAEGYGMPALTKNKEEADVLRDKIAIQQAELAEIESRATRRFQEIRGIEKLIQELKKELAAWDIDWTGSIERAENIIRDTYYLPDVQKTPYNQSVLECAFTDIERLPILQRMAPDKIASLTDRISKAERNLKKLREG